MFFRRNGATWYPDEKVAEALSVPILVPEGETLPESMEPMTHNYMLAPVEKKVSNMVLNFGPQHPAAHGVLRLVMELDGEVIVKIERHKMCSNCIEAHYFCFELCCRGIECYLLFLQLL